MAKLRRESRRENESVCLRVSLHLAPLAGRGRIASPDAIRGRGDRSINWHQFRGEPLHPGPLRGRTHASISSATSKFGAELDSLADFVSFGVTPALILYMRELNVLKSRNVNVRIFAPDDFGYAVFGRVLSGMDVCDRIAAVPRKRSGPHDDVPIEPVVIKGVRVIQ